MEYQNGEWRKIGTLASFRKSASSISHGDYSMVIGGAAIDGGGRYAVTNFTISKLKFRASIEVWNFTNITSRTINSLEDDAYWSPVLFLVDPNYCVQEIYPTPVSFFTATNWPTSNSYVPTNVPTTAYYQRSP